jgi:mono/diheme cytochrome c family protein
MKKNLKPVYLLLGALTLGGLATAYAQTKVIKEIPVHVTRSLDGAELFHEFCAVCHGADAKGGGPAADALKRKPTDLTQLTRKNNGKFPTLAVQMSIKGSGETIEHGTADMPMWGKSFSQIGQNKDFVDMRVFALVKYVEQIQAK